MNKIKISLNENFINLSEIKIRHILPNHATLDNFNFNLIPSKIQNRFVHHASKWNNIQSVPWMYFSPIEHSLHHCSLKYQDSAFSEIIEDAGHAKQIEKLNNKFNWKYFGKIILIKATDLNLFYAYDGSHRLSYLKFYGLKRIPRRLVKIHVIEQECAHKIKSLHKYREILTI